MSYDEQRVRVSVYGSLSGDSPLLVPVRGLAPYRLHAAAEERLQALAEAAAVDGFRVRLASAWRRHRWRGRAHYEATLIRRYKSGHMTDAEALRKGRRYLAYASPHETGLAVDFRNDGLFPRSATVAQQRRTPWHAWLVEHAWRFGWHPYKAEPWHWECPLPVDVYDPRRAP